VTADCRTYVINRELVAKGIGWCYVHEAWCGRDAKGELLPTTPPPPRDDSAEVVLREVRRALVVPEGASLVEFARFHFARSVVATEIYNIMDSMPEGVGEAFIRDRVMASLASFPKSSGQDQRISDERPRRLSDAGHYIPRSLVSAPLPGEDVS
jgi:hypothetical protein